jgi:cytoskeletal protein RodZ
MREVPLREVADVTKISLRYLEALEQDRFDVLPAPVFAKGFLREYSRYVGLDADEVVNSFLIANGEVVEGADEEEEVGVEKRSDRKVPLSAILALLLIVAIVAVVALVGKYRDRQPVSAPPIAAPVPLPPKPATTAETVAAETPAVPLTVIIDFTEDCWVEAVVDSDRTISELRVQGESMRLEAQAGVLLTLGNPGGVRVEVNGRPYDFSYTQNRIVRNLEIDLALVQSLMHGDDRDRGAE